MGRPRKPTYLLELEGALKKNPKRYRDRANEPRPTSAVGDPPAAFLSEFSPTAKAMLEIWHELLAQEPAPGTITGADRMMLESACRLIYEIRRGNATAGHYSQMRSYLADLGMSPAGRTKIATKKPDAEKTTNPWEELAGHSSRRA